MSKNKNANNVNVIGKTVGAAKNELENRKFRIGGFSLKLSSVLIYLACFLCAIFIWANVYESTAVTAERTFDNIPVIIRGENALSRKNLAVFELIDKTVKVTLDGAENKINELEDEDISAYIDVSEIEATGTVRVSVSIDGADKLHSTVSPSVVKVFVDEKIEVDIPLKINPTYSVNSQYVSTFSAGANTVTVGGAKSIIDRIKEARVSPELGEITNSTTANAKVVLVDVDGAEVQSNYISMSDTNIVVKVNVQTEKTVPLTYSFKNGYIEEKNIKVTLSPSEIKLVGDPAQLADIESLPLLEIDETKLVGNSELVVSPVIPEGIKAVDESKRFDVKIELLRASQKTVDVPVKNISVRNPKGLNFNFVSDSYLLTYIVDTNSAKKVSAGSFTFEIDLSAFTLETTGVQSVMPTVIALENGYTLYPVNITPVEIDFLGD